MTLLPLDSFQIVKAEGPKYKVGSKCCVPGCNRWADHAHHLWRRSWIGGDVAWVEYKLDGEPGILMGNLVGLCYQHHDDVTGGIGGHRAKIALEFAAPYSPEFAWWASADVPESWTRLGSLDPQPPLGAAPPHTPSPDAGSSAERCPTCGHHRKPKVDLPPGEKRAKKAWQVAVPVDHREDGFEIIETLIASAAEMLGRGEHKSFRYYTLVEVLAYFVQSYRPGVDG